MFPPGLTLVVVHFLWWIRDNGRAVLHVRNLWPKVCHAIEPNLITFNLSDMHQQQF